MALWESACTLREGSPQNLVLCTPFNYATAINKTYKSLNLFLSPFHWHASTFPFPKSHKVLCHFLAIDQPSNPTGMCKSKHIHSEAYPLKSHLFRISRGWMMLFWGSIFHIKSAVCRIPILHCLSSIRLIIVLFEHSAFICSPHDHPPGNSTQQIKKYRCWSHCSFLVLCCFLVLSQCTAKIAFSYFPEQYGIVKQVRLNPTDMS